MAFFIHKNGFEIHRCPSCGLCQTKLEEDYESFVKRYYSRGYFEGEENKVAYVDYEGDGYLIKKNLQKYLQKILQFKTSGKLLDVGCAYGYFLEHAKRAGFDVYGVEPSEHAAGRAQERLGKKSVTCSTLSDAGYKAGSFDVITMLDVFEHLGDPDHDIREAFRLLAPDGILLIATGDTDSLLAKIQKDRWTFYIPPQHLFFFNRPTLTTFLHNHGFVPAMWFSIGKWLSLRYVVHLAATTGKSALARMLYPFIKATPLARIPLYIPAHDNMVVIAQKVS